MFQTPPIGRSTALSLATYTVIACLAIAVTVNAWHYTQRIAGLEKSNSDLEKAYVTATQERRKTFVREFATKFMSHPGTDLELDETKQWPDILKNMVRKVADDFRSRPLNILAVCVTYHPSNQNGETGGIVFSSSSDGKKLCEKDLGPEITTGYHRQGGISVELVKDDDTCAGCLIAIKEENVGFVARVGIVPESDGLGFMRSIETSKNHILAYPYLPAWIHSGTILLSIGVGCFVISSGRRLRRTANRLSSLPGNLEKLKDAIHDTRNLLSKIRWDGFHQLDTASARRLEDVKRQVDRAFYELAVPKLDADLGAANWLRKAAAGWDGDEEFTDLAEMARRVAAEEGTEVQQGVAVAVEDIIAQRISEYDAVTLLRNLIGNAFKHGDPPIRVTVTRTVKGPYQEEPATELVVVNDGTPYVPAIGEGKGHGLKIVRDLAKKYGGDFEIVAGDNGKGAVARLTLDI